MERKELIAKTKIKIKELTEEQIQDKKILRKPHTENTWQTMTHAHKRALKITLFLNFYNQIRNKTYQHSIKKYSDCYMLNKIKQEVRTFSEDNVVAVV